MVLARLTLLLWIAFLKRCHRRRYNSEKLSIYDLLKQSDRNLKLCDKISKDKHHPLYSILPNVRGDSHESRNNECDIGFQVQFNVEFTSQVMDFP